MTVQQTSPGISVSRSGATVEPVSGRIGAEISGIDISRPLDDSTVEIIRQALDTWKVVFFRGQKLDHGAQIAFGRRFGNLTYAHPHDDTPPDGYPEIYTVDDRRLSARLGFDPKARRLEARSLTSGWHTDVTPAINPPAGSILRADIIPSFGGDTTFTNLMAAYKGLSEPVRAFVDTLRAEHRYGANWQGLRHEYDGYDQRIQKNSLVAIHPVVRVHPRTGERALFVNPGFVLAGEPNSGNKVRRSLARWFRTPGWRRWVSPLVLLALWELATSTGMVSTQKVPSPATVWTTAVHLVTTNTAAYGTLQGAMAASLERMAIGFSIGAAAAVVLAVAAGLSRFGENAVDPPMQMLRTLPLFGLVPVFIVWFGIGQLPKVLLIALAATVPLYLNVYAGIRSVDARLGEFGRVLGLGRFEFIRHVVLPGALPQTLVGLRQSLGAAWLALVVAEQLNVSNGLGFMISQATQFLQDNVIFVVLLVYTVLGLLTDALVRLLERRALVWRRGLLG